MLCKHLPASVILLILGLSSIAATAPHVSAKEKDDVVTLLYVPSFPSKQRTYFAVFAARQPGSFSWDVDVKAAPEPTYIAGMVHQVEVEWRVDEERRKEIDQLLNGLPRRGPIALKARGHWVKRPDGRSTSWARGVLRVADVQLSPLGNQATRCVFPSLDAGRVRKLTNEQLLKKYVSTGESLVGTGYGPTDMVGGPATGPTGAAAAKQRDFHIVRREIISRGSAIEAALLSFVRAEARRRRTFRLPPDLVFAMGQEAAVKHEESMESLSQFDRSSRLSFFRDSVFLLKVMYARSAAPLFLEFAEDERLSGARREAALHGLQWLTYNSLNPLTADSAACQFMVEHPLAQELRYDKDRFRKSVSFFRTWLQGEGEEPAQWVALAQKRARKKLASSDVEAAYCAAHFLQPQARIYDIRVGGNWTQRRDHDNAPEQTMDAIAKWVQVGRSPRRDSNGWIKLLAGYGPLARSHATLLIEHGGVSELRRVGGRKILDHAVEHLPQAHPKQYYTEVRSVIDRWAGRDFASDEEREQWWREHRDESDEVRMRANLPTLVAQAEGGANRSLRLTDELILDAPFPISRPLFALFTVEPPTVSLKAWYEKHAEQLEFNEKIGAFQLR